MDVSKIVKPLFILSFCMSITSLHAQVVTCQELLNKLPSPEAANKQAFGDTIAKYEEDCKLRPTTDSPEALKECIKVGMRAMGTIGNYLAQIRMAKIECQEGNDEVSKTWLGMIVNNNNASEAEKEVAREAIATNPSLPQNQ